MSDRRRSATLPVASLAALALAAAGFYGGVEVQKDQGGDTASGAVSTRGTGGPPSATGATGASTATTGTVKSTTNGTLTVTTSDGKAVKVKPTKDATVTRNAMSDATAVHPGDTVVIEGKTASDGTVTATSVTASSAD